MTIDFMFVGLCLHILTDKTCKLRALLKFGSILVAIVKLTVNSSDFYSQDAFLEYFELVLAGSFKIIIP